MHIMFIVFNISCLISILFLYNINIFATHTQTIKICHIHRIPVLCEIAHCSIVFHTHISGAFALEWGNLICKPLLESISHQLNLIVPLSVPSHARIVLNMPWVIQIKNFGSRLAAKKKQECAQESQPWHSGFHGFHVPNHA